MIAQALGDVGLCDAAEALPDLVADALADSGPPAHIAAWLAEATGCATWPAACSTAQLPSPRSRSKKRPPSSPPPSPPLTSAMARRGGVHWHAHPGVRPSGSAGAEHPRARGRSRFPRRHDTPPPGPLSPAPTYPGPMARRLWRRSWGSFAASRWRSGSRCSSAGIPTGRRLTKVTVT